MTSQSETPSFSFPELHLETVTCTRLGEAWNGIRLSGYYWRLYHHDSGGAGVYLQGRKVELLPERLYLLPPNCDLRTWNAGNPVQVYLHFELTGVVGSGVRLLNELSLEGGLRELYLELERNLMQSGSDFVRRSFLASALASAATARLPGDAFCEITSDPRIIELCSMMREKLAQPLNVEAMGRSIGLSENVFLRLFRDQTGVTPYQYLLHLRYSRAAHLLASGRMTIDDICEAIGVRDRFHFSRTFKKLHGTSPGEYRKNAIGVMRRFQRGKDAESL